MSIGRARIVAREQGPRMFSPRAAAEFLEPRTLLDGLPFAENHTIVEISTTRGVVIVELFDDTAPLATAAFLQGVSEGRYSNTLMQGEGGFLRLGLFTFEEPDMVRNTALGAPLEATSLDNVHFSLAMVRDQDNPAVATGEWVINQSSIFEPPIDESLFEVFGHVRIGFDIIAESLYFNPNGVHLSYDSNGDGHVDASDESRWMKTRWEADLSDGVQLSDLDLVHDVSVVGNPGWSQQAGAGRPVDGYSTSEVLSFYVTTNSLGRPIAFTRQNGTGTAWSVQDIGLQSGAPALTGAITAAYNNGNDLLIAAAPSASGLLAFEYSLSNTTHWRMRNLTTEITGALNITSEVTAFVQDHGPYIAGLATDTPDGLPQIVYYKYVVFDGGSWSFVNIGATDLAAQGRRTPAFIGDLTSFVTAWGGLNIAGLDAEGDIHTVWWAPGEDLWRTDNLSDLTGAPRYFGSVTAFASTWGGINYAGTDAAGNVLTTWWSPSDVWQTTDLSTLIGTEAPRVAAGSMCGYVTPWGGLNIAGISLSGLLVVYWWSPQSIDWDTSSILDNIPEATAPVGRLNGSAYYHFENQWVGRIDLVGTAANGDVVRYFWSGGSDTWSQENFSETATADLFWAVRQW